MRAFGSFGERYVTLSMYGLWTRRCSGSDAFADFAASKEPVPSTPGFASSSA
jgi:hypothetical protein